MFGNMKLSVKLMTVLVVLCLLPLSVTNLISFFKTSSELKNLAFRTNAEFANLKIKSLESYFTQRAADARIAAVSLDYCQSLRVFRDRNWDMSDSISIEQSKIAINYLNKMKEQNGLAFAGLVGENGKILVITDPSLVGGDVSSRDFVKRALSTGDVAMSSVFYSSVSKTVCLAVFCPVLDNVTTGKHIGFVQMVVDAGDLSKIVHDGVGLVGESADSYLINANGVLSTNMVHGGEALKDSLDTEMIRNLSQNIKRGNTGYTYQGIYKNNLGKEVLGTGGVVKIGDNFAGLIIEVEKSEVLAKQNAFRIFLIILAFLLSIAVILTAIFFSRSIALPLNKISENLKSGAELTFSASSQVSSSSQSLAEGASEQASSIEETSASLEQVASMSHKNTDNAQECDKLVRQADKMYIDLEQRIKKMVEAVSEIQKNSLVTQKIIKTIDEIAFQTNLLALNAAVEAARAGVAGAGFAVVANEVRNLAMRASQAAHDTSELIENTVNSVKTGTDITEELRQAVQKNVEIGKKIATLVAEIANASGEQSKGIDQVISAISQINEITQQNAANAEESASAASELDSQSKVLMDMVEDLNKITGGKTNGNGDMRNNFAYNNSHKIQRKQPPSLPGRRNGSNLKSISGKSLAAKKDSIPLHEEFEESDEL